MDSIKGDYILSFSVPLNSTFYNNYTLSFFWFQRGYSQIAKIDVNILFLKDVDFILEGTSYFLSKITTDILPTLFEYTYR